jgi:uncharacterized protein (TIGR02646 family)
VIRYAKGPIPRPLEAFAATYGADWSGFGGKAAVREALVRDQRSVCAYCQRRIADGPDMKIEHWVARSEPQQGQALELDWRNLLGVCSGATMLERHCDTSRGDRPLESQDLLLCPVEGRGPDPRRYLRYLRTGKVYAFPANERVELDIEILNLNAPFLVRGRKAILDELERALTRVGFTPRHVEQRLGTLDDGNRAPEFVEAARDYLVRKRAAMGS